MGACCGWSGLTPVSLPGRAASFVAWWERLALLKASAALSSRVRLLAPVVVSWANAFLVEWLAWMAFLEAALTGPDWVLSVLTGWCLPGEVGVGSAGPASRVRLEAPVAVPWPDAFLVLWWAWMAFFIAVLVGTVWVLAVLTGCCLAGAGVGVGCCCGWSGVTPVSLPGSVDSLLPWWEWVALLKESAGPPSRVR